MEDTYILMLDMAIYNALFRLPDGAGTVQDIADIIRMELPYLSNRQIHSRCDMMETRGLLSAHIYDGDVLFRQPERAGRSMLQTSTVQ